MTIRFKCPHCQKPLSVGDHLAGKKAACPVCKKAIAIPAPVSAADVEAAAAEALADKASEKLPEPAATKTIDFTCPFCDEELKLPADLGGKKAPCPKCTKVIKIPLPQDDKPRDWRTSQRAGPSAVLANQPEQLADAWGTEQKGRVSQDAMAKAGALREPAAKPAGARVWIRRGFWICLVGGAAAVLIGIANRSRLDKREKNHLKEAEKYLQQLDPLQKAEFYRASGELDVRNLKASDAQTNFALARSLLPPPPAAEELINTLERDLFLIKLVLAQLEMGGTGDETLKRGLVTYRFDWKDEIVQKDMLQTLEAIHNPEAKASALRSVACKLMAKDKADVAVGLTAALTNTTGGPGSPLRAQQIGLLLARGENQIETPDAEKPITDAMARVAYTEGHAFKRNYGEALKFSVAKGPAAGRLHACVAGAAIALADAGNKDGAKEALPFIREGLTAYGDFLKESKDKAPSWAVLELIRLGSRTDAAEDMKTIVDKLPAPFRPRAQLDLFQGQLDRNPMKPGERSRLDDIGEAQHPTRGFAWEALARHNARLGYSGTINVEDVVEVCRPFVYLGIALGEQDRNK
jgi:hypothetical protein